jgi:hypothetical protein
MEDSGLELIFKTINGINDNIWLGDLETANSFAQSNLDKIRDRIDISAFEKTANKAKRILQEIRKKAKDKDIKDSRLWVATMVSSEIEKRELNPIRNIFGVLTIYLSNLIEAVGYLIEAKSQRTLGEFADKASEKGRIFRDRKEYRYAMERLPDKWEVRAIVDVPPRRWNLEKLTARLSKYDLMMEVVSEKEFSIQFELYSRSMYILLLGGEKRVSMLIHSPMKEEDVEKRITEVVETILSSLTTTENVS